ncbi:urease accessory protein UreD [Amycolatopsis sp. NPDC051372]|uniref:urease accessory protein UreD n=1 Tax=unclassified Amycolatopsis TaxID=2618356 RepID=UPI003446E9C8
MLLAGDRLELDVEVGAGTYLELIEPSGTVAYNARGGRATYTARVKVGAGGSFIWRSAPFVIADGADVERDLDVALDEGGVVAFRETLVLGRYAEDGGSVLSRQRVTLGGAPLLVETLDLRDPRARALPGMLGLHRVVATAMVLGLSTGTEIGPGRTPLAGHGMLARALTGAAHEADHILAGTWSAWLGAVEAYFAGRRPALSHAAPHRYESWNRCAAAPVPRPPAHFRPITEEAR